MREEMGSPISPKADDEEDDAQIKKLPLPYVDVEFSVTDTYTVASVALTVGA